MLLEPEEQDRSIRQIVPPTLHRSLYSLIPNRLSQFLPLALEEKHYSVKELAQKWKLSPAAIRRLFRNEPGTLRFGKQKRGHRRDYVTLRIPAPVAERVYRRCTCPGRPDVSSGA